MENGKRMEFKGVAEIVILAIAILAITGITTIGATTFSAENCPNCSESGLALTGGTDYTSFLHCVYYSSGIPSIEQANGRIYVSEYNSLEKAINAFEDMRRFGKTRARNIEEGILSDNDIEFVYMVYSEDFPDIEIHGCFLHSERNVIIEVFMKIDTFTYISANDITKAKTRFQAFAKCAHSITGWKNIPDLSETKEEYTLTLEYYPLFPYLEELEEIKELGEVVIRPAGGIGGDLRATLKKKYGEGKSNEFVYFYVEKDTPLHRVLTHTRGLYYHWEEVRACLDNVDCYSYIGAARTDSEGIASFNYISKKGIIPNVLMEKLVKHNGKVKGTVKAVVMKPHGEVGWEIEHEASVPVKFECIAKIMKIEGKGVLDKLPIGMKQGTISGPGQVRVQRGLFQPNLDLNTSQKEGFELMPADIINIDGDTSIEIVWINGDRAKLIVPETDGVKEAQPVGSINFILASSAYDSGFYTHYEDLVDSFGGVTYEKGINMMLDRIKDEIPFYTTAEKSYEFVVEIIEKTKKVDLSQVSILTKIRIRSKVIIDSAGDEISVYNIEGSPDIKTVKGEEVTLADKEMVTISENGSLSEVQSFDPEEVLNEFYDTVNGSITIKAETASTVERETVKLTVMGVAGDPIRVESSPLSDNVLFKEGIDDTPTGANYHVNWFTDTIDADGIRRYAVEFNDMGIYTITATVTGGDREGDSDTVEITVLEEEVPLDLPAPIPSELEISKLFTSKSVYHKGEKVDVHYYITNTGMVDVDDYHVEYDIIDVKGKTVYENVGGAHSISAGDENKWHSENWEIPSNAKIGPYIIDCRLIWDSKKDTAGREFFVTHPAKREDRTAELEISNLYAGKSEYLKGAGERVDVCYYVKNTGTVDISEYHVIYQIFDSEGKRYCWFISDMFGSIVAGKEDKWQSSVWNVPSDAKVGRYTIDAMVIWGLDRFSRETAYFFVK